MMRKPILPLDRKGMPLSDVGIAHFKRCSNPECRRPFKMIRFVGHPSGFTDTGKLVCPHCGSHLAALGNSIYLAQSMTASEESSFNSWTPGENERR